MSGSHSTSYPITRMADMLRLFLDKRLSANEPEHLTYIKGRLAEMKADCKTGDQDGWYKNYSEFYGVDVEVKVLKEPKVATISGTTKHIPVETPKKKLGRPAKS